MAQPYMIVNEYSPEDCEAMDAGIPIFPEHWKGTSFYCTCPGGVHGYFMVVAALRATADHPAALAGTDSRAAPGICGMQRNADGRQGRGLAPRGGGGVDPRPSSGD